MHTRPRSQRTLRCTHFDDLKRRKGIRCQEGHSRAQKEAERLYKIVHSGLGILYRLYSELNAVLYILEHHQPPLEQLRQHLDALKFELGNVYEFDFKEA